MLRPTLKTILRYMKDHLMVASQKIMLRPILRSGLKIMLLFILVNIIKPMRKITVKHILKYM